MDAQRNVAFVISDRATSSVTGRLIDFWPAELTHPSAELERAGFRTERFRPDRGELDIDGHSDRYADHGCSVNDEISRLQPFWVGEEAKQLPDTTLVAGEPMAPLAIRSGNQVTGRQQHSGGEAACLAIEVPA
jgi:hypothetical protein